MSSNSAEAMFSVARPIKAFSYGGPPTLIAETIMVIISRGAVASIMHSDHPKDWLRNCMVTRSQKRANSLG